MTGVAVNVTTVSGQTGLADGSTDTLTVTGWIVAIVIVLEVAGLPVAQVALEVSTQVIASLFAGTYA